MTKKIFLILLFAFSQIQAYKTEEFTIASKRVTLSGTFTTPEGKGPYPTVLLIGGFGPNDRDQHIYGHKTLLVLAEYLAANGVASFRYDKRGIGKSTGEYETATTRDLADDAKAVHAYLHDQKQMQTIGLIGHSEGGAIGAVVAAESPNVAFLISLGAPAVPGEEILLEQGRILQKAIGLSNEQIELDQKLRQTMFAIVKDENSLQAAEQKLRTLTQQYFSTHKEVKTSEGLAILHPGNIDPMIRQVCSPWFRYFLTFDASKYLEKVPVPVLAIGAEKDLQVPVHQNIPAIRKALAKANNQKVQVVVLKNHNHLFQTCKTGAISEYSTLKETLSDEVLQTIKNWITD